MKERMYYDRFAEEYVLKKDEYSAPERYLEIWKGINGVTIESWDVNTPCKRIDIAYLAEMSKIPGYLSRLRHAMSEKHNVELVYLDHITIPANKFDELYPKEET